SRAVWVAAQGALYRLTWDDGRVAERHTFDGRPGVYGVAVDPVNGHALVSTVGRLPDSVSQSRLPGSRPLATRSARAQLAAFGGADGAPAIAASGALGEFIAGAPAVARTPNA